MRLKESEVQAIVSAFTPLLDQIDGKLYLFGSRTDVRKKGGDIDLLVVAPASYAQIAKDSFSKISHTIQAEIGEQRIDITFAEPSQLKSDPFLASISDETTRLR